MLARSLITGRSNLVAVVVNSVGELWDTFFLDGLFQSIQALGKQPLIVHTHAAADLRQVLQDGASYQIDGVLVFADNVTPEMTKQVFRSCRCGWCGRAPGECPAAAGRRAGTPKP